MNKLTQFLFMIFLLASNIYSQEQILDNTAQPLPFSQDWSTTSLITVDDNWTGVSGITGYRGDNLTVTTGVDPQTVLIEGTSPIDVIANQTNPSTSSSGGVGEFEIVNPVVALQGSSTADAPFLLLSIQTLGKESIRIQYNVRDVDSSTDNSIQAVALQYRIGTTGDFTNVASGFIADATTGPNLNSLITPIDVTLPSNANNQTVVQVRIITTNAAGNDEWVGIDDISITGTTATTPSILVDPITLTGFSYTEASGPSTSQSYSLSGSNLSPASGNLTVSGSTNYEVSSDNSTFGSSINITYNGGTLADTTVYVRLKAGLSSGTYNGELIANSGGGADVQNVTCDGFVISIEPTGHASSFIANLGVLGYSQIDLTWSDAGGTIPPEGYLIKAATTSALNIVDPVDGVPEVDGWLARNVAAGVQTLLLTELKGDSNYFIKIFPYRGTGAGINYKTDGGVPEINITTDPLPAGLLFEHNFLYSGNITNYGWSLHSGSGTPIQTTSGLTYSGYPSSGIGNAANVSGTQDDLNQAFAEQNTDGRKIYLTALVNLTETADPIIDTYFMHLGKRTSPTSFTSFCSRVWLKAAGSNVNFGLSNTGTVTWGTTNFARNTTYLIIVKYTINTAGADDVRMWVVSSGVPANEIAAGTPEVAVTAENGQDAIDAFALRQTTSSPDVVIDGIRIATNWLNNPASLTLNLTALIEGFYNTSTMIQDTVTVQLRNSTAPYNLVEEKEVELANDGTGTPEFLNAAESTPYYLAVRHRNSIETWSKNPQQFTSGSLSYDFTSAQTQAYGDNLRQVGTKWCIYSGDVNQDGAVDLLDMIDIDNDAFNFASGYLPTDANGDGNVDLLDMIVVDNNAYNFVGAVIPSKKLNSHKAVKHIINKVEK